MSSILDALRKLEQEKAGREQLEPTSIRGLTLESQYEASAVAREERSFPTGMAAAIVVGILVIGGITAGLASVIVMMKQRQEPIASSVTPPAPVVASLQPPETMTTITTPAAPLVSSDDSDEEVAPAPAKKPVKKIQVAKASATKPAAPKTSAETDDADDAAEIEPPPAPTPSVLKPEEPAMAASESSPSTAEPVRLDQLPLLTETERLRLQLPALKINIVGLPNGRNSRASALINMQKVYVGENIPGTDARLFDVDLYGVGLEIKGRRYYLSKR